MKKMLSYILLANLLLSCKSASNNLPAGSISFVSDQDGNREIYVMAETGENMKNLTNNPADDFNPSWSPDGKQIVFVSHRSNDYQIYIMNSNGSKQNRLTNESGVNLFPVWSPDGINIAFLSDRDNVKPEDNFVNKLEIYLINLTDSSAKRLTNDLNFYYTLAWSSDGSKILSCATNRSTANTYLSKEIDVLRLDSLTQEILTKDGLSNCNPALSPNGEQILFVSMKNGYPNIYLMNIDGTEKTALTNDNFYYIDPSWSPDGKRVVFASRRDGDYDLYIMNVDGSGLLQLTNEPGDETSPSWSTRP